MHSIHRSSIALHVDFFLLLLCVIVYDEVSMRRTHEWGTRTEAPSLDTRSYTAALAFIDDADDTFILRVPFLSSIA